MKDKELNAFRARLLDPFDGSYEGEIRNYLGCEIEVTWKKGLLLLVRSTMLRKFLHPDRAFHSRYRGIVGSLDYLVNMTRPDLAFA